MLDMKILDLLSVEILNLFVGYGNSEVVSWVWKFLIGMFEVLNLFVGHKTSKFVCWI